MQEGMDKFIRKPSAGYGTNKPLWMTHRDFKAKIRNISIGKNFRKASYMLIMYRIKSIRIELWQKYIRLKNHLRKSYL